MNVKNTFSCITQSALSSDDFKVLSLLYQPIMGCLAHSLFLTLYQLVNKNNYQSNDHTHQFLCDLLNEKAVNIQAAREALEALNLMETYKKDNHFIYQLRAPLSARGFIQDTILGQFLLSEVGNKVYKDLVQLFKVEKVSTDGFEKITKQFDDLFTFKPFVNPSNDGTYLGRKVNTGAQVTYQLNYDAFIEKLPNRLKKSVVSNHKTEDLIQKLVFIYQFSLDEIAEIYIQAAKPDGSINLDQLKLKAQIYYIDYKQSQLIVEPKTIKEDPDEKTLLRYLKTSSPMRIINNFASEEYQILSTDTVQELVDRAQVEIGVINTLLMHVIKRKNGVVPHINYFEKILDTWLKRGINNTELAYKFVTTVESSPPSNKESKSKEKTWIDDYYATLDEVEVE